VRWIRCFEKKRIFYFKEKRIMNEATNSCIVTRTNSANSKIKRKYIEMDIAALERDLNSGTLLYEKISHRVILTRSLAAKQKKT